MKDFKDFVYRIEVQKSIKGLLQGYNVADRIQDIEGAGDSNKNQLKSALLETKIQYSGGVVDSD